MNITFGPRGVLEINDARIVHRNLRGEGGKYNREGDRNFSVVIPNRPLTIDEIKSACDTYIEAEMVDMGDGAVVLTLDHEEMITVEDLLRALGWNVKIKAPREEGDEPFIFLPVKVKFNDRGPVVYLVNRGKTIKLDEETVGMVDEIDILHVDLDVRPFDWNVSGKEGRTAYLQGMAVTQDVNRFDQRYAEEEYPEEEL